MGEMKGKWQVSQGWLAFPLENTKDKEVHERLRVSVTEVVQTSPFCPVAPCGSPWSWEECSSPWENTGRAPHPQPVPLHIANSRWINLKGTAKLVAKVSLQDILKAQVQVQPLIQIFHTVRVCSCSSWCRTSKWCRRPNLGFSWKWRPRFSDFFTYWTQCGQNTICALNLPGPKIQTSLKTTGGKIASLAC